MPFINFGLVDGRLIVTLAPVTVPGYSSGLSYRPTDMALLVSETGVIVNTVNGFPLDGTGRLAVTASGGPVMGYNCGFATDEAGLIQITAAGTIAMYVSGWPVDAAGRICVTIDGAPPVATVPNPPTGVTGVRGNASVSVSFTPGFDGGAAITSYTATASPGGANASGPSSPIVVSGLTNGTAYTFTVTATNSAGTSVPSAPSAAVTPATVPGAPTGISATRGDTTAAVIFTAPVNTGGSAIINHTATSTPGGVTANGTNPITVPNLVNGTSYTFTVHANNSVGAGAESATSNAVVPAGLPSAPGAPVATAGNANAHVVSTAADPNGSAVTNYVATSSPGGLTASGAAPDLTVSGLTNETSYTFTMRATNLVGSGASSASSNAVTPTAGTLAPSLHAPLLYDLSTTVGQGVATFDRGLSAYVADYLGTLRSLSANVPRFQGARYVGNTAFGTMPDGTTPIASNVLLGYFSEGGRMNACLGSLALGAPQWSTFSATATLNSGAAPDGTNTASKVADGGTANTRHGVTQTITQDLGRGSVVSVYAKSAEYTSMILDVTNGGGDALGVLCDLTTGAQSSFGVVGFLDVTLFKEQLPNGWWRFGVFSNRSGVVSDTAIRILTSNGTASSTHPGVVGNGILVWGAQFESGSFPSSIIATTTAVVSRPSDVLHYPVTGNFSAAEGSAYAEYTYPIQPLNNARIIGNGATGTSVLYWTSPTEASSIYDGSSPVITNTTSSPGSLTKGAANWSVSGSAKKAVGNGGSVFSGGFGGTFDFSAIFVSAGNEGWFGYTRNVKIYPAALSDAELIALTA